MLTKEGEARGIEAIFLQASKSYFLSQKQGLKRYNK